MRLSRRRSKEGQQIGPRAEEYRWQARQVHKGRVEQGQLAVAVKDGEANGQLGKGLCKGLNKVALGDLGSDYRVDVCGVIDRAVGLRCCHDVVPAGRRQVLERDRGAGPSGAVFIRLNVQNGFAGIRLAQIVRHALQQV